MKRHPYPPWTDLRHFGIGRSIICALVMALALALPLRPAVAASASAEPSEGPEDLLYEMPVMMFFIAPGTGNQQISLTIGLTLELEDAAAGAEVDQSMPLITDGILQLFTHKTSAHLDGSDAIERLRAEILAIVTNAVGLGRVHDVLFRQMLTRTAY